VIHLLEPLGAAGRQAPTYALRESRWDERGNAVAARALVEALEAPVRRIATAKLASVAPTPSPEARP